MSIDQSPLAGLSVKISTAVSQFFSNGDILDSSHGLSQVSVAKYADLSDWVSRERFINFEGMMVRTPIGLKVGFNEYLEAMEKVWGYLGRILTDLLKPLSADLAVLANKPSALAIPGTFDVKRVEAELLRIDPMSVSGILAKCFDKSSSERNKFGKVFRGARDMEGVAVRTKALRDLTDDVSKKEIHEKVSVLTEITDLLLDEPNAAKMNITAISKALENAAGWVELYGVFMMQLKSMETCLEEISAKIVDLRDRDKRKK